MGPNAAGKSTLIKTWVGFLPATRPAPAGVVVMGIDPWSRPIRRAFANLGYVPQSPSLYDGLSPVSDHLDLAAQLRPGFDRASAQSSVSRSWGSRVARRRSPVRRSAGAGGARACARHACTDLLLLDEPLASLSIRCGAASSSTSSPTPCASDGSTALLSSHIVTDVEQAVPTGSSCSESGASCCTTPWRRHSSHTASAAATVPGAVATFLGPDGAPLSLLRDGGERPATLEEIVLGYLASSRVPAVAA